MIITIEVIALYILVFILGIFIGMLIRQREMNSIINIYQKYFEEMSKIVKQGE